MFVQITNWIVLGQQRMQRIAIAVSYKIYISGHYIVYYSLTVTSVGYISAKTQVNRSVSNAKWRPCSFAF